MKSRLCNTNGHIPLQMLQNYCPEIQNPACSFLPWHIRLHQHWHSCMDFIHVMGQIMILTTVLLRLPCSLNTCINSTPIQKYGTLHSSGAPAPVALGLLSYSYTLVWFSPSAHYLQKIRHTAMCEALPLWRDNGNGMCYQL